MAATDGDASMDELLRVENLSLSYGHEKVLEDICLSVAKGEKVGICGRSGAGKTTLARCIMGLERPDAGRVLLNGSDISRMKRKDLIGMQMIPQAPASSLEGWMSVRAAILEGARTLKPGREAMERMLPPLLARTGLDAGLLGRRTDGLSGGEKARVAIARALALSPSLLIADEPTASLDASLRSAILNVLASLDMAMIIISHDEDALGFIAARTFRLDAGRLIEE